LVNDAGTCFEAVFETADISQNSTTGFKAQTDP
jgi:hypothetical protein